MYIHTYIHGYFSGRDLLNERKDVVLGGWLLGGVPTAWSLAGLPEAEFSLPDNLRAFRGFADD